MSRIGKLPIEIPVGVKVSMADSVVTVQGPKGTLSRKIMDGINVDISDKAVVLTKQEDTLRNRAAYGLSRTLVNNMVVGVTKGFERALEITGVGYRAESKGEILNLSLGYSHPVNFSLPTGITVEVDKMTKLVVKGIDKELVGQVAAKIRSFRGPEPYKGKGIRYADETILRKAGKTGKK
jgi:large subunit ribosomal protein L6